MTATQEFLLQQIYVPGSGAYVAEQRIKRVPAAVFPHVARAPIEGEDHRFRLSEWLQRLLHCDDRLRAVFGYRRTLASLLLPAVSGNEEVYVRCAAYGLLE